MEREDTSLVDTALREAWEEVGLTRENVDVWTVMDPIPGRVLTGPTLITPVVAEIHQDLKELGAPARHSPNSRAERLGASQLRKCERR